MTDINTHNPGTSDQTPPDCTWLLATLARRIVGLGPICDSCLGRQFAMLSTGTTNVDRGRSIKSFLAMAADSEQDPQARAAILEELSPSFSCARLLLGREGEDARCWVCLGQMDHSRLERLADIAAQQLKDYEYSTFLVGTRMSGLLAENEELLLADGGSCHAEPFKSELNREVGKLISLKTGKGVSLKDPDITVHVDLGREGVDLQVSSIYIYGRYRKLVRGIPQTRWPCRKCKGAGCTSCNMTGRMYSESVDELIRDPVIEDTRCEDTVFHGAGREDIDARMLGSGRPFVVEAVRPHRRSIDLLALEEEINRSCEGKVEVLGLVLVKAAVVEEIKAATFEKTYRALIDLSSEVPEEKLKSVLAELVGSIDQRTPTRVSHRRADRLRKREVFSIEATAYEKTSATLTIRCDSGLYVKELVSGDGGRTNPSISGLLGVDAVVRELDVINVGGESDGKVTRSAQEYQG